MFSTLLLYIAPMLMICIQVEGQGQVFIGYPSFINSSDPVVFSFSVHDANGAIPVYIIAYDNSQPPVPVPITADVHVSCELSINAVGFTSAVFQNVTLTPLVNYTDLTVSNLTAGRKVDIRCFGDSLLPSPAGNATTLQFTKATSISRPIPLQVTPPPTVNFCQDIVLVPDPIQVTESTFELELSDPVEGGIDNLDVTCTSNPVSAGSVPAMSIFINTSASFPSTTADKNVSFVLLTVPFTVQSRGSALSVNCSAQSLSGNQYRFSTSQGSPSQFEMEDGSVHLYPEFPEFIESTSPLIKSVVYLDKPVTSTDQQVTLVCQVTRENNTQEAISRAQNFTCSFDVTTTTTVAPTLPINPNVTVSPEETSNRSLWEVSPTSLELQTGSVYRPIEILRTVDVSEPVLELVLLTCCVPPDLNSSPKYINKSVALLTSVYLQPSTTNWTSATASGDVFTERSIPNPAYVDVSPCPCDLTKNACNVDCCCDQDCTDDDKDSFTSCIEGLVGGFTGPNPTHFCNSTHINKDDWFKLMCVEFQSSAVLGLFYSNEASARTQPAFNSKLASVPSPFSYRETTRRSVDEVGVSSTGYKHGGRVKTAQPLNSGLSRSGVLTLPQRTMGGQCLRNAPVRFLKDSDSDCTYTVSRDLCTPTSVLSARMYAQGTSLSRPPCPQAYQVLSVEDASGKAVVETSAHYFCSTDNSGFINTPDTVYKALDPYTKWLFDYNMPNDTCQDILGNDICRNLEGIDNGVTPVYPRCGFDDGFSVPPAPVYNLATQTCENAVLSVSYNFTWSGQRIMYLNASFILGDLPVEVLPGVATKLTQTYSVLYHHNYTYLGDGDNPLGGQGRVDRSGYPGYDAGKLVLSGKAITNGTTQEFYYVNSNLSNQITVFNTAVDGLCYNAGKRPITFQDDTVSECALRLGFQDLNNCTMLRKLIVNRLNSMMSGDYLSRFGFLTASSLGYWVPIIREDLSIYFPEDPVNSSLPLSTSSGDVSFTDELTGICVNVTSGIHLEILYGETGKTLGASILEIIGGRISYSIEDWTLKCSGTTSPRCHGNVAGQEMVDSFYLKTSVRFTKIPVQIPDEPILFWRDHNPDLCEEDSCWRGLFYPLTGEYKGEQPFYTLVFTQVFVLFLLFFFMITRPWW